MFPLNPDYVAARSLRSLRSKYYLIKTVVYINLFQVKINSLKFTSTIHPVLLTEALNATLTCCHLKVFLPLKRKGLQVLQHTSDYMYKDKCPHQQG